MEKFPTGVYCVGMGTPTLRLSADFRGIVVVKVTGIDRNIICTLMGDQRGSPKKVVNMDLGHGRFQELASDVYW